MKNKYCTFYIVRHGQTEWNVIHRIQGQLDSVLTEQGENEAKKTGEKLKNVHFDAVYSSDLFRAKYTAEIMIVEKKLKIMTSKALRERTFGRYDGTLGNDYDKKTKHLHEEYKRLSLDEKWRFKFDEEYESDEELVTRFMIFLAEVAITYPGKIVLIVTHGGNLRMFLTKLGYAKQEALIPGTFKNAGYIIVESDGADFVLKEVEGIDHSKGLQTATV